MVVPAFLILYLLLHRIVGAFCPSVWITGFPCPGCGMTRALGYVLEGEWVKAFRINPSIYMWIAFGIYFIIQRYVRGKTDKYYLYMIIVIVIVMFVIYIYGMFNKFPNQVPYTYRKENVMSSCIPWYDEMIQALLN